MAGSQASASRLRWRRHTFEWNAENDQEGEYYNDDLEGTIEWEIVDIDRGFGSKGQDFIATITTKDGETRELEGRELEDAEQHVRDDMQGAHDDAGDAQYHAQQFYIL